MRSGPYPAQVMSAGLAGLVNSSRIRPGSAGTAASPDPPSLAPAGSGGRPGRGRGPADGGRRDAVEQVVRVEGDHRLRAGEGGPERLRRARPAVGVGLDRHLAAAECQPDGTSAVGHERDAADGRHEQLGGHFGLAGELGREA